MLLFQISFDFTCSSDAYFELEDAWQIPCPADLKTLHSLKSTLIIDQTDLQQAVQYLRKQIIDFPGEYFLQSPFIFKVSKKYL